MTDASMITFLESNREIKKQQVIKFEKYFRWELVHKDDIAYILLENLGKKTYNIVYEFEMNGFSFTKAEDGAAEEEDVEELEITDRGATIEVWELALKPSNKILKKLYPCETRMPDEYDETDPFKYEGWKHSPGSRYYEYKAKCDIA